MPAAVRRARAPARCRGSESATQAVTRPQRRAALRGRPLPGAQDRAAPRSPHAGRRRQAQLSRQSSDKRGRYVRATQTEKTTDLAFDATMRAAAPHQAARRAEAAEQGRAGAPPRAPGPAPEGPPPAHRHPDRLRRRRQRVDGRRAADAGDQGRGVLAASRCISAPRQGVARRLLRPRRAGGAPADVVGRPRGAASAAPHRRRHHTA